MEAFTADNAALTKSPLSVRVLMSLRHHEAAHRPGGRRKSKEREKKKKKELQLEKRNPTQDLKVHLLREETKRLEQWQKQTGRVYYVYAVNSGTTASAVLADSF